MTSVTANTVKKGAGVRDLNLRRLLEWGGVAAGVILIAFGVAAVVLGATGRMTVGSSLAKEKIVGAADMTPSAIRSEAARAGLNPKAIDFPTTAVAGKPINSGSRARAFAQYMRIHTLESTGGFTYSQVGPYTAKADAPKAQLAPGGGTDNPQYAVTDPKTGQLVGNPARDLWVTETALTTALNTSYMAEQLGNFGMVVGIALLLSGIGFTVLALGGALRGRDARAA